MIYINKNIRIFIDNEEVETWEKENRNYIVSHVRYVDENTVVRLNPQQEEFAKNHQDATLEEVINCSLSKTVANEKIRATREELYTKNTDSLYIAYQKYLTFGDEKKAEIAKQRWIQAVLSIKENNPYI